MSWYIETKNGAYRHPEGGIRTSHAGKVALSMLEASQKYDRGRVYVLAPIRASNSDESNEPELLKRLAEVPELVFVPEVWTSVELVNWESMSRTTRWWTVGARSGWLEDHIPVLPFSIVLTNNRKDTVQGIASVGVTVVLGEQNFLVVNGVRQLATSLVDVLDKLEKLYWSGEGVVFLGALLNQMVTCDTNA